MGSGEPHWNIGYMDENLIKLDARLGALELLIRNLYAHRFAGQDDPVGAAEKAARNVKRMSKQIEVTGPDPAVNDLLAAEVEDFLVAMFHEIVEIVRQTEAPRQPLGLDKKIRPVQSQEALECPKFLKVSPKLHRTG